MNWLNTDAAGSSEFERVLGLRPELLERYRRFYGALWEGDLLPLRLLELARLRIAAIHDCAAEFAIEPSRSGVSQEERDALRRGEFTVFEDPLEQCVLRLAEQLPHAHHFIEDSEFDAIKEHLEPKAIVALMTCMALVDTNCRLRLTFGVADAPSRTEQPSVPPNQLF